MAALTLTQTPTSKFAYLYPEDDGCDIDCFPFGSTSNWSCVDDTVDSLTPDETYVFMSGASTVSDVYKPVDHGTLSGTINYVKGCCRAKSDQFPPAHDFVYKVLLSKNNACTDFATSEVVPLSTGFTTFEKAWRENPFTAAAWTWGEIDDLQVGFEASSPAVIVSPSVLLPIGTGDRTDITDGTTGYEHWEAVRAERPLTQVSEDGAAWKYDLYEFIMGDVAYHSTNVDSVNKFGDYVVTTDHTTPATHIYQWNGGQTQFLAKVNKGGYTIASDGAKHFYTTSSQFNHKLYGFTYSDVDNTLTLTQTYDLAVDEFSYSMVYEDGYLYVAASKRLLIFSVADDGTLTLAIESATDTHGIAYDGTYLYGVNGTTLRAYSYNSVDNILTEIDDIACAGEYSLACDRNQRIFAPIGTSGLKLFSFNGTTLSLEDTIDDGGSYARVAYSGGFIHTYESLGADRLRAYSYVADTLALVGQYLDTHAGIYSFASKEGFIFIAGDTSTGFILSFNGTDYHKMHDIADGMLPKYIDDNIVSVSVIVKMGKEYDAPDEADIRGRATVKSGGTEYPMTGYWKLEHPFKWYAYTWTDNPDTSAPWTLAEVKALQAGVGLYGTGTKYAACSVCQVVVAATSTITPEIHTSKAYLKINYTPPASSCSLTTAKQVSTNHARNIKMLNFWTGKREVYDDLTRSTKSMVVTGSEYYTGACDRIICARNMARIGEAVTITGFSLGYFNGTYMIRQFGWKKVSEKPEHYEWIIALEDTEL